MAELENTKEPAKRVFLMGFRGSGKSTIGKLLAEQLGWACADTDDQIETSSGTTIRELFETRGEEAFRDLEQSVVSDLCEADSVVIALGGGAMLREATRERLATAGPVFYLTAPAETLAARIGCDAKSGQQRPSLTGKPIAEEVAEVLAVREPIYQQCANVAIDVDGRTPEAIADEIATWLRGG